MLKLMYITNRPDIAQIAENAGVDRIFVDLEYIGKAARQGGMDTVQSKHSLEDIKPVAESLRSAELVVRINPLHEATEEYCSTREEIDTAVANGAQIIMLPYFNAAEEAAEFVRLVDGRAKTFLLVETPEAVRTIDEILDIPGVDAIHIGLNDLSIGYQKKFMFELLCDGTVESICNQCRRRGIPYGFGGIASLGKGLLPSNYIIAEHYRLGSSYTILSRCFCNVNNIQDIEQIRKIFNTGVAEIRDFEKRIEAESGRFFAENHRATCQIVNRILAEEL